MIIILIGMTSFSLGLRAVYYSRKRDAVKLKRFAGTKNPTIALILGVIGLVIGFIFFFLGLIITFNGDK